MRFEGGNGAILPKKRRQVWTRKPSQMEGSLYYAIIHPTRKLQKQSVLHEGLQHDDAGVFALNSLVPRVDDNEFNCVLLIVQRSGTPVWLQLNAEAVDPLPVHRPLTSRRCSSIAQSNVGSR